MGKEKVMAWLVGYLMQRLDAEDIKKLVDKGLDVIEDRVMAEPDKYDDLIISVIKLIRTIGDIPDND